MTSDDTGEKYRIFQGSEATLSQSQAGQPRIEAKDDANEPPDGGYGWICVVCQSFLHIEGAIPDQIAKVHFS